MDAIQPPIVPVVGEWIRQTPGTISLGQGMVRYGPPAQALDAAAAAVRDPDTSQYHDVAGLPALLDRIERKLERDNGLRLADGRRVIVTAGANMAFVHAVFAITSPGDEVILLTPFYFNHDMAVAMAGCRVVGVPVDRQGQPDVDAIRRAITGRTRAIVTVSPNNPTGAVLTEASLRAVNSLCAERGLYHIADEVYEYFTYGAARHVSSGALPGAAAHTIALYSLSKAYGFAGWRIGYIVFPEALTGAMLKSQDTILACAPVVSQIGAAAALDAGRAYCEPFVRELDATRTRVLEALRGLGDLYEPPTADGAFYIFLRLRSDRDAVEIAERLVREHRVAVMPGRAFGVEECSFRIAYGALQPHTVDEGIGRLVNGLRAILA